MNAFGAQHWFTIAALAVTAAPAFAQTSCPPVQKDWFAYPPSPHKTLETVPLDFLRTVPAATRDAAIQRLATAPIIALSTADAEALLGAPITAPEGRRPYLIRSIFAVPEPYIALSWVDGGLLIETGGMGCGTFHKQPLVVFLERTPERLYVEASSDL